jgi:hypothetical protein
MTATLSPDFACCARSAKPLREFFPKSSPMLSVAR